MLDLTRLIGLVYLGIGIYVLFRRWTAPRATHFYIFCLVSFALNTFHYTGKFDLLDWTIYWGNVVAEALQPALFLHFALVFPEERLRKQRRTWLVPFSTCPLWPSWASASPRSSLAGNVRAKAPARPHRDRLRRRLVHSCRHSLPP